MNILNYYNLDGNALSFTRQQASRFAKLVAGDFNPIHDENARRFCVPGDLLFSVLLSRYGLARRTSVSFDGMVNEDTVMTLPEMVTDEFTLKDVNGRSYLTLQYSDQPERNEVFVTALTEQYVQFSGQTFPGILVELMQSENVMINPDRPLVVYKKMTVELDCVDASDVELVFDSATLSIDGKKGEALLKFLITAKGECIGRGQKTMLLGGLRPFDQAAVDGIVLNYTKAKGAYLASNLPQAGAS